MPEFLSELFIISNGTDECENTSSSNTQHLNSVPGLRVYKAAMIGLPLLNCLMNSVSFVVFRSLRRQNDFHRILMCLAGCDALFQLVFTWLQLFLYLMESNMLTLPSLEVALLVAGCMSASMYAVNVLHLMRNWLVVLISYYRYHTTSVLRTGKGCLFSPPAWPRFAVFATACLAIALPRCFEFSVVICARMIQVTHIAGYLNNRLFYRIAYHGVVLLLVQSAGPLLLLTYFSSVLCYRVHKQNTTRRNLSSSGSAPGRSAQSATCTRLVACLCVAFLLCETPTLAKALDPMSDRLQLLGYLCNLLVCVDSSLNCLIYGCTNRQFARALARRLGIRVPGGGAEQMMMLGGGGVGTRRRLMLDNNGNDRQLPETAAVAGGDDSLTSLNVVIPPASAPSAL